MSDLNITRAVGQLNRTEPTDDAVAVMVLSGVAVGQTCLLLTRYQIFSTAGLVALGITLSNNPLAYQDIIDFYAQAGQGAELNFMLVVNTTSLKNICDVSQDLGKKILDSMSGRGVMFLVNIKRDAAYVPVILNGLDKDVSDAVTNLNAMALAYDNQNIPFVGFLPALGFAFANFSDIPERSTLSSDYVALNTWCNAADGVVSMGQLAGKLAAIQVSENAGRVASGKLSDTAFMPDGTSALRYKYSWDALAAKGLLIPVKRGLKSGFFYKDDPTNTRISSDYSSISWNRTMNKAKRIAADILLEHLNDDIETDPSTGLMEGSLASDWESDVENAIRTQMSQVSTSTKREITGVKCSIDPKSDINNDKVSSSIQIVRKGQAKQINVSIGYVVALA